GKYGPRNAALLIRARLPSVTNFLPLRAALFRAGAGVLVDKAMRRDMATYLGRQRPESAYVYGTTPPKANSSCQFKWPAGKDLRQDNGLDLRCRWGHFGPPEPVHMNITIAITSAA